MPLFAFFLYKKHTEIGKKSVYNTKKFKGVLSHLTANFSYFQNIYFLKVSPKSDQNLFTELKHIKIK